MLVVRLLRLGGLGETAAMPPGRAARPEAASSVGPIVRNYWPSLRPCLGTTIAPRRRARFHQALLALIGAAALALAGCGANDKAASGGAEIVPANAPAFVTVDSNADSSQWRQIEKLLEKFPDGGQVFSMLRSSFEGDTKLDWERDVKPALGDEIALVWLDFTQQGENVVGITKPKDKGKFEAAVKKANASDTSGDKLILGEHEDWVVFSDSQAKIDRFEQQVPKGDSLADDATYKDAIAELPDDSLVAAFARGRDLLQVIKDTALLPGGSLFQLQAGQRPEFIAAALAAQDEGIRLVSASRTEDQSAAQVQTFESKLLADVPGDAVAFLAFRGGEALNRQLKQLQGEAMAQDALKEFERMSGLKIDAITGLFKNEVALYVRAGTPFPEVTLLLEAPSEQEALTTVDNLLMQLTKNNLAQPCQPEEQAGVTVKCVGFSGVSIRYAAFDGKVVVTSGAQSIEEIRSGGPRLADDDAFKGARDAAGMPDATAGFVWLDFEDGLPLVFSLAEASGSNDAIPPEIRRNLEPLRSLIAWTDSEGRTSSAELFLAID